VIVAVTDELKDSLAGSAFARLGCALTFPSARPVSTCLSAPEGCESGYCRGWSLGDLAQFASTEASE
jgi:hypothetical protein